VTAPRHSSPKPASPLRYPGGKGCLAGFLAHVISLNGLGGAAYYEPYAGGAGAALELLRRGLVSEVFINDADPRIASFWTAVLGHPERFTDRLLTVPLTIAEWQRQREVLAAPQAHDGFELGFAAFYLNRCNRSGVLVGAGPIGGMGQQGKWRLDARFNREQLARRIFAVAQMRAAIRVENQDALCFLRRVLPRGAARARVFVYLDPPYVNKGPRLYLNSYAARDHVALAAYLGVQRTLPWVVSYDDTELVRSLYAAQAIQPLPMRYSLHDKRVGSELLIAPRRVVLPPLVKHAWG